MAAPVLQTTTSNAGATAASVVVTIPTGVVAGDVVIVAIYKENTNAVTPPAGYTEIPTAPTTTAPTAQHMFWHRASGSESGTVTFSWTGSVFNAAIAHRISGCASSGNPYEGSLATNSSNASVSTLNVSLASTTAGSLTWWAGTDFTGGNTWTAPTGYGNLTDKDVLGDAFITNNAGGATGNVTGTANISGAMTATLLSLVPDAGGAVSPARPGRTWLRQFKHRQVLPPPPAAAAPPPAAPAPLVAQTAATPGFGQPATLVTVRSSLQDFATPVTPAPVIAVPASPPGWGQPAAGLTSRNSLADAPVLTTPPPEIIQAAATPGWGQPEPAVISSAPLIAAAAPAAATPAPLVVTPAPVPPPAAVTVVTRGAVQDPADFKGRQPLIAVPAAAQPAPVPPVTSRNSLADAPVLTTPAPEIIPQAATPGFGRPGPPIITAAPLIPVAAPTQATPPPVVAWTQPPAVPPQQALTSRNSLADAPVLTTPPPVVAMATAVTPWGKPQAAVITRSPAAPPAAATPQPVVVAQAVKLAAAQPPVITRNPPAAGPPPPPPFDPYQLAGTISADITAGAITAPGYAGTASADITAGAITTDTCAGTIGADNYAGSIT